MYSFRTNGVVASEAMTQNELAHTGAALEILGLGIAVQGAVFFSCLRRGLSSARLFVDWCFRMPNLKPQFVINGYPGPNTAYSVTKGYWAVWVFLWVV